ncbi:MAG: hypothetical protein E6J83_18255, partial [Deltaproteobacteria bacterium]
MRDPAAAEREGPRGHPRRRASVPAFHLRGDDGRGPRRGVGARGGRACGAGWRGGARGARPARAAHREGLRLLPELRKDPIAGRWVVVATERVRRPADFAVPRGPRRDTSCLFCGGHEDETPPELLAYRDAPDAPANSPGWRVRVVPNRFPALRVEGVLDRRGEGLYDLMNGVGADEVLVESADHHVKLADLAPAAVEDVVRALRDRLVALKRDTRLRAALLFKRHAADAPGRLGHPHAQLLATPIVPREVLEELDRARAYYDYRERCLFCDILRQELEQRTRLVVESEHVLALAPFAARFPFET